MFFLKFAASLLLLRLSLAEILLTSFYFLMNTSYEILYFNWWLCPISQQHYLALQLRFKVWTEE